jgi:hypothetical protein
MSLHALVLLACADGSAVSDDSTAPIDVPVEGAEADDSSGPPVPVTTATSLTFLFPPGATGFVEIRPTADTDDIALATVPIDADQVSIELPGQPPDRDTEDVDMAVYALSIREATTDGLPGRYTGLAPERLAYVANDPPEGALTGWNLVSGADGKSWRSVLGGVSMATNLVTADQLAVSGGSAIAMSSTTHLSLEVADPQSKPAWDGPILPAWTVAMSTSPRLDVLDDTGEADMAVLTPVAYDDLDGDNTHTDEVEAGHMCAAGRDARLVWVGDAVDLAGAVWLEQTHLRSGWDVMVDTEEGLLPATDEARAALTLAEDCEG